MSDKQIAGNLAVAERQQKVIVIEASKKPQELKLRVAAYIRVSFDSEDQLNSFAAQERYYSALISGKESWTLVDIYADRGISGTSAEKREELQRLLSDCRKGLIDRVLCKSISRFARNTQDCLESIRELKALGISVCFEKESIDTAKVSGEMLTALFASMAQKESESISGNMRWSYPKRMASGIFNTCKPPLGYRFDGRKLEIFETEAIFVREIFDRFLAGQSCEEIARYMNTLNVPTRDGKQVWHHTPLNICCKMSGTWVMHYCRNVIVQIPYHIKKGKLWRKG